MLGAAILMPGEVERCHLDCQGSFIKESTKLVYNFPIGVALL